MINIDFRFNCDCGFTKDDLKQFYRAGYFVHPVSLLDLKSDYMSLIGGHKKNFQREAARCEKEGYTVRQFHRQSYITEVVEINKSKSVRSGGEMKNNYLKSVEEWGGQPATRSGVQPTKCPYHRGMMFGCFSNEKGYWGDGKLVAYIGTNIYGNFVNYSTILGHGDYLNKGIMQFLHLQVLKTLKDNGFSRYVIYYLFNTKEQGLMDWKRRAGFREHRITFTK